MTTEFTKGEKVRIRGHAGEDDGEVMAILDVERLPDINQLLAGSSGEPLGAPDPAAVAGILQGWGVDYCVLVKHRRGKFAFMALHTKAGEWRDLSGQRLFLFHHYQPAKAKE